mmetsp:Transcript_3477/g.9964  ORF Transcript_3477/g.9964 Transcript_3477/m.9964 type:complete len:344 (-) Transcript_3477:278-1309(-)|eukprot:CAMPEP_0119562150 /NCGR_PEP_ID=MMETSP1352-20130426/19579_1 /TAXON_ID=265584 /ORGANISM="Stauroneis constricta, Strain CCMP1120" /LENGTH=343 /DNA_ID=CAMNT_0007610497 /DNA_START=46 /DNA_END=1077 /DNA_ORIENTATION=+
MIMNPSVISATPLRTSIDVSSQQSAVVLGGRQRLPISAALLASTAAAMAVSASPSSPAAGTDTDAAANGKQQQQQPGGKKQIKRISVSDSNDDGDNDCQPFYTSRFYCRTQPHIISYGDDYDYDCGRDGGDGGDHDGDDDDENSTETTATSATAMSLVSMTAAEADSGSDAPTMETAVSNTPLVAAAPCATRTIPRLPSDETTTNLYLKSILADLDLCLQQQPSDQQDASRIIERWNALGLVRCHTQNQPELALQCHQQALLLLQQTASTTRNDVDDATSAALLNQAITHHDIGYCYERLHQNQLAQESYGAALRILEEDICMSPSHPRFMAIQRSKSRVMRS